VDNLKGIIETDKKITLEQVLAFKGILETKENDILVFRCKENLTARDKEYMLSRLKEFKFSNKVLILDGGMKLTILRKVD